MNTHIHIAKKIIVFSFVILLFFPTLPEQQIEKIPCITVFVHGIMSIHPYLSLGLLAKFSRDNIRGTFYADTVAEVRKDPFFRHNQLMQQEGLVPIPSIENPKTAAQTLACLYDIANKTAGFTEKNYYYTFGWSGLLSQKARIQAAKAFFPLLCKEIKKFHEKGIHPKVRLVGYSHGANVCLNLAEIQKQYPCLSLVIDELILLGCPIQSSNDFLVNDPLFKKIYNLYSKKDRIQPLDPFLHTGFFAQRIFKNHQTFFVPPKVTQADIKVTRVQHKDNQYGINPILATRGKLWNRGSYYLHEQSPGHVELWSFGWTPKFYRNDFVLFPYPIVIFVPFALHALQKSKLEHNSIKYPITLDVRPDHQEIMITGNNQKYSFPFPYQTMKKEFYPLTASVRAQKITEQSFDKRIIINKHQARENRIKKGILTPQNIRLRKIHN